MTVQHVNDTECERILVERVGLTALAFLSYDIIACDHFRPELGVLAEKMASRVAVLWIDVDENPSLTEEFLIESVPTLLIFREGDEIARFEGPYSREALIERIGELL